MQKKFQIFISSTFVDLEEERRAVIEAILDLGHIPIGMEAFQAGNEEQWDYIKKRIDESDYYVVLVAERYGSEKDGVSYTEMEYDYAQAQKVPVAAFLLAEEARKNWRAQKSEYIDNPQKLNTFREKCRKLLCKQWKNKDELARLCSNSINTLIRDFPRDGWIPAKQALSPDVVNELARLSKENEELREKLKLFDADTEADSFIQRLEKNSVMHPGGYKISFYRILFELKTELLTRLNIIKFMGGGISFAAKRKLDDKLNLDFDRNGFALIEFFNLLLLHDVIKENRFARRTPQGIDTVDTSYELTEFGKRVVRRMVQLEHDKEKST